MEFKPKAQDQMVIGMQVMQQWSKEKIIQWWAKEAATRKMKDYKENIIKWLQENLK